MKREKTIEIDLDLYKIIVQNSNFIDEAPNEVLKRLLSDRNVSSNIKSVATNKGLTTKGVFLPEGTLLQKRFKGENYEAIVKNGYILLNGRKFTTLSGAAVYVAEGNVNGWRFWEYCDEKDGKWKVLETLRNAS